MNDIAHNNYLYKVKQANESKDTRYQGAYKTYNKGTYLLLINQS